VSRIIVIFCFCKVMPLMIVLKSLFSNGCSFISVEVYNGDPYNNKGRITVLKINNFNLRVNFVEHNNS
jgi:hypothetical protein